jgi:hypothetical protein
VEPAEREAAELILIRDVQQHYFPGIYNALLKVKAGASSDAARQGLTPKERALVDKHQICMNSHNVLVAVGRFIKPKDEDINDETKRAGFHRDLIHVMEQYFHVSLGSPPGAEDPHVYSGWEDGETDFPVSSTSDDKRYDWATKKMNKWLEDNTSIDRELILMPNRGLVAESIMRQSHNNSGHAGINYTMRVVTQKFWIVNPTKLYNHVKTTCFMCRFFANKLWQIQEGLLPSNKVVPTYPFQYVGIDIAGPVFLIHPDIYKLVMNRSKVGKEKLRAADPTGKLKKGFNDPKKRKYFVLLIVCAATRLVSFELMKDTSSKSIVEAYETFCSTKGRRPSYVLSDNASDFEKTNRMLQEAIKDTLSKTHSDTRWVFLPSLSPWWGGQYEIFVRMMKSFLWKCLPNMKVEDELSAYRHVKAAEGVLNSRPLYIVARGINSLEVLTPNHFQNVGFDVEEKYFPYNVDLPLKLFKQLKGDQSKRMRQMFYQFHQEYLTYLRAYHKSKGCFSKRPIKVGDFVLIKSEEPARNFWPIARVAKINPSNDGVIRTVMLQKYLPYAINAALRESKYHKTGDQKLTKEQVRELTGYFEDMDRSYSVKNLVPYELWKGDQAEPEDMDDGQLSEIVVSFGESKLKGSNAAFYGMSKKKRQPSQVHQFNNVSWAMTIREDDVWTSTQFLDEEFHQHFISAWSMED